TGPPSASGATSTVAAAPAAAGSTPATAGQKPAPKPQVQRPYSLVFSLYASNALNHTNRGAPVGNMTSPFFLKSTSTSGIFIFGPGGTSSSGGNRQIVLRVRLSF
ncbi:MAG: hypothetical protein DMF73_15750, partial [Acidobacteria bacterium]